MQGTNAHALISSATGAAATIAASGARIHFRRHSFWVASKPYPLLQRYQPTGSFPPRGVSSQGTITMSADLSHPSLASLWDHHVSGLALMPGAALLLAASAAASLAAGAQPIALVGASLTRAMLLSTGSHILMTLSSGSSSIQVSSTGADYSSANRVSTHLIANACRFTSATQVLDVHTSAVSLVHQIVASRMAESADQMEASSVASVHYPKASHEDWSAAVGGGCPRALDASLHLGAVDRAVPSSPSALLVPAGLQAFMTGSKAPSDGLTETTWACAHQASPPQEGTKLSTHFCSNGSPTVGLTGVYGLLSRPMRAISSLADDPVSSMSRTSDQALAHVTGPTLDDMSSRAGNLPKVGQYSVRWLVESPEASAKLIKGAMQAGTVIVHPNESESEAHMGSGSFLMGMLSVAQKIMTQQAASGKSMAAGNSAALPSTIRLQIRGAFPSAHDIAPPAQQSGYPLSRTATAAGQWALLRAAATELPTQGQPTPFATGLDSDPLDPASAHSTAHTGTAVLSPESPVPGRLLPTRGDQGLGSVFGEKLQSGVRSTAVLSPMGSIMRTGDDITDIAGSCVGSCGGVVAITGGMGALGSLTAQWVGHGGMGTSSQLLLTGRSGRSSQAGALQLDQGDDLQGVCVTMKACDSSSAAEASCMTQLHADHRGM